MPTCPDCGQENPAIARFCLACATPLSPTARPAVEAEERKVVSVLFCDLVGFTALSDLADPEDVRATLRPYHTRVRQEVERFGGTMEKFIGDGVMAVFGAPVAHEDDAERAVRAGLRILDAIEELNRSHPGLSLAVRIGINSGEVVVSPAAQVAGESMVVGDVVNTASRLESVAPTGGVVVGEATFWATRDMFEYERLEPVVLKGKAQPVPVWRAGAARRGVGSYPEALRSLPFFDREDELDLLARTFARTLRERSVQFVTLVGEPGVGKTRLVREFAHGADLSGGDTVTWRRGRCLPYGEGITFWPLGEIVKAQAGILESDTPEEAGHKLNATVDALFDDASEQEWIRARVGPLAGVSQLEGGPIEKGETYAAWLRFLEAMASAGPLALLFEDLHWADEAMLEFLAHLADWSTDVPLFVVCTARPELYERQPDWGGGMHNSSTISLSPLPDEEIRKLVSALLPGAEERPGVHDAVLERAGGNPLYAEEFARMITDREPGSGGHPQDGAFPESIHAIIAARLDTLAPDRKALLQDASVVGREFWSGALASMSGVDDRETRERLHELSRKELVRPARVSSISDQAQYTFWHALIRDVAYAQIPRAARARKHRQVAEWTEALAGDRVADHGELIAHHYRQALELTRAAGETRGTSELEAVTGKFVEMAGDRALGLDAKRAAEHFGLALDLLPAGSDRRAPLLVKVAEVAARNGQFEEAERTYRDAIDELMAQADPRSAAGAMVKLANLYWHRGETARGRELTGEAIAVLEREEPGPELIAAHTEQANDYMVLGLYEQALQSAKRALSLMEMLGIREQAPNALSVQGMARWYMGDPTGVDDLRAALDMATAMGIGRDAARLQAILGEFIWVTEGPEAGMKATDEAIDIAEHRGNADLAMAFRAERLWPLFDLGRWDELLADAEELTTWSRTSGEGYFSVVAAVSAAQVLVYRGQVEQAAELARSFLPSARQIEDPQVLVQALAVTALIERYAGKGDRAIELVEEFERITRQRPTWFRAKEIPDLVRVCAEMQALPLAAKLLEGPPVHARRHQLGLLTARAVLEEAAGELDAALRTYAEAAEGWAVFGFALERGRTTLGAGRCLVGLGRSDAIERLSEARSVFTTLGAAALVAETNAWVARAPARIS